MVSVWVCSWASKPMYLIYFELQTSDKYNLFKMTKGESLIQRERLVQSLNLKHPLYFVWQLVAPLSLVCHCWTFVVIDDKGGERLIKALGIFVSFAHLCTWRYVLQAVVFFWFLSFIDVSWVWDRLYHVRDETYLCFIYVSLKTWSLFILY